MKKTLLMTVIASGIAFSPAYAAEETSLVDAGVTPDSFLYSAEQFLEEMKLALTFNEIDKAELLISFANERLAEAKEMTSEEQTEFLERALEDYKALIKEAEEATAEVIIIEEDVEVEETLSEELDSTTEAVAELEQNLDEETLEELEQINDEVKIVANVAMGLEEEVVTQLRNEGFGFGEIARIVAFSNVSGLSIDELVTALKEGKGLGEIAKENGIHPGEIAVQVKETRLNAQLDKAEESGDQQKVDKINNKLKKLEERKAKFAAKSTTENESEEVQTTTEETSTTNQVVEGEVVTEPVMEEVVVTDEQPVVEEEVVAPVTKIENNQSKGKEKAAEMQQKASEKKATAQQNAQQKKAEAKPVKENKGKEKE